jgi:protein-disulfide isomerase
MRHEWRLASVTAMLLFMGINSIVFAEDSVGDLKKQIEDLKAGQQVISKELLEIKSLLSKIGTGATPQVQLNVKGVELEIGGNPVRGSKTAKLALIEFTDYQCQFCSRHVRETLPLILEQYINKGILRYAVIDNPLPSHKMALKAAEASHCANDQGKYWEMHELMMSKQESLDNLSLLAASLKFDMSIFNSCLSTNKYKELVDKNSSLALKQGIKVAPAFILGSIDPYDSSKIIGISFIPGARPIAAFQKEIEQALTEVSVQKASK